MAYRIIKATTGLAFLVFASGAMTSQVLAQEVVARPATQPGELAISPATAPSTQPADEGITALIKRLGDDDFRVREEATEELFKCGKPALPELTKAVENENPEIQLRAQTLITRIEAASKPAVADVGPNNPNNIRINRGMMNGRAQVQFNGRMVVANGGQVSRISVSTNNGIKTVDADENGVQVSIKESPDGIDMSITRPVDGKPVTEDIKAKDAEELKKDNPEAFKLYEKYAGQKAGNMIQIRGGGVLIAPVPNDNDIQKQIQPQMPNRAGQPPINLLQHIRNNRQETRDNAIASIDDAIDRIRGVRKEEGCTPAELGELQGEIEHLITSTISTCSMAALPVCPQQCGRASIPNEWRTMQMEKVTK